jgi:FkbM family methyltransferase
MQQNLKKFAPLVRSFLGAEGVRTIIELGARDCRETLDLHSLFPQAQIYTFECNPQTLPQCREAVRGVEHIELVEKAVSDVCGRVKFYPTNAAKTMTTWPDGNPGASSLLKATGKYPLEQYVQDEIEVEAVTLQAFMAERSIDRVDVMWMDIQGSELMALRGAATRLRDVHLVQLEVAFFRIYHGQPLFPEVKAFLNQNGFLLVGFMYRGTYFGDAVFMNRRYLRSRPELARRLIADRALYAGHRYDLRNRVLWAARKARAIRLVVARRLGLVAGHDWAGLRHALYVDYLRYLKPRARLDRPSDVKVDVVIVAHEKDMQALRFAIPAVRRFLLHPIGKVFVMARDSPQFRQLCREHECEFVDEDAVLPITKNYFRYVDRKGRDRSGWLFQQLLKLNADTVAGEEHYFVIDADTVLIRPCALKRRGKTVLFCTEREFRHPYYEALRKLLGNDRRFPASFICHQMLFEKSKLRQMKAVVERLAGKAWWQAILDAVDTSEPSCFSEYETYGNFLAANYPKEIDVQRFSSLALPARELSRLRNVEQRLSLEYQSISFHAYLT